jgi:hypothetical protein
MNPFKKFMFGLGVAGSSLAHAAEKAPVSPIENPKNTTEAVAEAVTTAENNSEVVNFISEREVMLKKLQEEKTRAESHLQRLSGELQAYQTDFLNAQNEALKYLGKKKSKIAGFETMLADSVMQKGEAEVATENITSPESINGLLGILLSESGPFKDQATALTEMLQGQLGSTVMMATAKPGKYISPDMELHNRLSKGPRDIVEATLKIVEEKHNLEGVIAQINDLKGDAVAQGEIPSVTF